MADQDINRKVRKAVRAQADTARATAELVDASLKPPPKISTEPTSGSTHWKLLQATCSGSGDGSYLKVYKETSLSEQGRFGSRVFLCQVENILQIEDFEPWVQSEGMKRGWTSGVFVGEKRTHGKGEVEGAIYASVDIPVVETATTKPSTESDISRLLMLVLQRPDLLNTIKTMFGGETGPTADVVKGLTAMMQSGLTAGTQVASNASTTGNELLRVLIEKLLTQKETVAESFLDQFIKLKNSGLIPIGEKEKADVIGQVNEISQLLDTVTHLPWFTKGGVAKREPGFWELLIPQLPAALQIAAAPLIEYFRTEQMRLSITRSSAEIPATVPPPSTGVTTMPPWYAEIESAIRAKDQTKFARLQEVILGLGPGGGQFMGEAQAGTMTAERAQELLAPYIPAVKEPESVVFIGQFLTWVRARASASKTETPVSGDEQAAASTNEEPGFPVNARGRCELCGEEYSFPSVEALEQTEPCEVPREGGHFCGGKIVLTWKAEP